MIDLGDYGHPPSTRRRDYSLVLLQLAIAVLINSNAIPGDWTVNRDVVRILGIAASIFIGFRNTQAIGRWWEARTLWGSIVNVSRSWADTLRAHLNSERINLKEERQLGLQRAEWIRTLHRQERIDSFGRMQLMEVANACTDAIGGLERIRNTPLPASYDVFVRLLTWLFGLLLLVYFHDLGPEPRIPISGVLIVLLFLMAERIGAYVEGPFDADGSSFSLPLDSICLTISRDLLDGEADHVQHLNSKDPVRWT